MMLKFGWPVLVPAFIAAVVVGTKLKDFDIPHMLKINSALSGHNDNAAPKTEELKPAVNSQHQMRQYERAVPQAE